MPRILIVDDEPEMVRGLEDNLRFEGYQTVAAVDGRRGLALALSEAPDLILLDVMMPGLSGWDVCRALRAAWPYARVTLVGLPWARELVRRYDEIFDDFVELPGYANAGRVYRITRDTKGFTGSTKLSAPGVEDGDRFGERIAAAGSLVAVTIGNDDYGEGAVALFTRRSTGAWVFATKLIGDVTSLAAITGAQRECTGGKVQIFDCSQVDLVSFLTGEKTR